jgi:hypothetical protein
MISLSERSVTRTRSGRTRLTFTIELPAQDEIGGARQAEVDVQAALHEAGREVMERLLALYDTDGEPIEQGKARLTSKGRQEETYQSLFGPVRVARHVYQSAEGGITWCPLEERARILENATCQFAAVIAAKYSALSGNAVRRDLEESLQRHVSLDYIQTVAAHAGGVALRREAHWNYNPHADPGEVAAIAVGIDGTCAPLCDEGYKQAMAGSLDLLDAKGERLETVYIANAPEEGKKTFLARMERELDRLKAHFPETPVAGISDGAHDLRQWLTERCDVVTLDFFHLSEYIHEAATAFGDTPAQREDWAGLRLHALKHEEGAAGKLLKGMNRRLKAGDLADTVRAALEKARNYLENNAERTEYALARGARLPIGSGVTEAACKHIIKERVCGSGMRWRRTTLQSVLSLRSLHESSNRWEQFWTRIERFGY